MAKYLGWYSEFPLARLAAHLGELDGAGRGYSVEHESATLFRRKYYQNGSHAGFILYMPDPAVKEEDVNALRDSKGPGNFRNLFMHVPNGKKDAVME